MNYKNLDTETWSQLDPTGNNKSGYKSICLSLCDNENSDYHIFQDEEKSLHFALLVDIKEFTDIIDPSVVGLKVRQAYYRILGSSIDQFIDLSCVIPGFKSEFTVLTKEICNAIFEDKLAPVDAVNKVIRNYKAFWSDEPKIILSEDKQIGLICELFVLRILCKFNVDNALESWKGPYGEINDFVFKNWNLEIKGTKNKVHCHTINGLTQLDPPNGKKLAVFSFRVSLSNLSNAECLQGIIENISEVTLKERPDLIAKFYALIANAGYSPVFKDEYNKIKIQIEESLVFQVNEEFPCLTSNKLEDQLLSRISHVRYDLSFEGLAGVELKLINWDAYLDME